MLNASNMTFHEFDQPLLDPSISHYMDRQSPKFHSN